MSVAVVLELTRTALYRQLVSSPSDQDDPAFDPGAPWSAQPRRSPSGRCCEKLEGGRTGRYRNGKGVDEEIRP